LCLVVLFCSASFSSPIESIEITESNTIYVDDDNIEGPWDGSIEHPYNVILYAIENASDGDIVFVYNGTYNDYFPKWRSSVSIYKEINLIGENKNNTIINGNKNNSVILVASGNVTVTGFTIQNYNYQKEWEWNNGLFLSGIGCGEVKIYDNIVKNCSYGIRMSNSRNEVSIYNNTILNNGMGVYSEFSVSPIRIIDNKVFNNIRGISSFLSELHLSGNFIENNTIGIDIKLSQPSSIIRNNQIENNILGIKTFMSNTTFQENNLIKNQKHVLIFTGTSVRNFFREYMNRQKWIHNYWDNWNVNRPRILIGLGSIYINEDYPYYNPNELLIGFFPFFEVDNNPTKEPYNFGA
jgi:parallel beta-helix repeat protein